MKCQKMNHFAAVCRSSQSVHEVVNHEVVDHVQEEVEMLVTSLILSLATWASLCDGKPVSL